jgi:hypothetical protein
MQVLPLNQRGNTDNNEDNSGMNGDAEKLIQAVKEGNGNLG